MIVTFYSYKGGTGRTMALANIAALLAKRGRRVLAVDFDLEAPGLWRYFSGFHERLDQQPGLIDLLVAASSATDTLDVDWRNYVTHVPIQSSGLSLMTSGQLDDRYSSRVLNFDWVEFFRSSQGGEFFENLRRQWREEYEFTLIDSRTGVTDTGGICTIMLPDLIIPVFVSNLQSLEGAVEVIARAQAGRKSLAYDRPPAAILPILSRFDSRTEHESAQEWLDISANHVEPFYRDWLPSNFSPRLALERTKLPYVAYFSFGETLPALTEGASDPESLGYALNTVSQLIEQELGNAEVIMGAGGEAVLRTPAREAPPNAVPEIWGNVPQRNKNFTGRDQLLDELRSQLTTEATAILPHALYGLGGVGKTQLANEYAFRYANYYQLVWWIPADQSALVRSSIAALAPRLGLTDIAPGRVEDAAAAVLDALRRGRPFDRWLLIFDNADQLELIREFIPSGPGDVIVTSRNRAWTQVVAALEVDVFTRQESCLYLQRRVPGITHGDADRLAEELGDLPLALEQAAALLTETMMTVDAYLTLLGEESSRVLGENPAPAEYPIPVAAAWSISVTRLRDEAPYAWEVLKCCAFFGPAPIPLDMLDRGRYILTSPLRDTLRDPILMSRSIRELGRYSLAKIDNYRRTIEVHRIVQRLIRDELDVETRESFRHDVHVLLAAADPGDPDSIDNWPRYSELLRHTGPVEVVMSQVDEIRRLVQNIVRYLYVTGNYSSGLSSANGALARWIADSSEDDPRVLIMHRMKAQLLRALGLYEESYELTIWTLERMRAVLGDDHEETLILLNGYCVDLRARGDFRASLELTKTSLERHRAIFGNDHPRTLAAMNNLAEDFELNSDYSAARELSELVYREKLIVYADDDHPVVLLTLNALARIMREEGHYQEARQAAEQAYKGYRNSVRRGVLTNNHPWVMQQTVDLSISLRAAGAYAEALDVALKAYSEYARVFGSNHTGTLAAAMNLGNVQRLSGDPHLAAELLEDTARRYGSALGPQHPYTLGCKVDLSTVQRRLGDVESARQVQEEALVGLTSQLGGQHHYTLICAVNLASTVAEIGEVSEAARRGEDALRQLQGLLGADHPDTLACAANLALDLRANGQYERANELATDTRFRYERVLHKDHPDVKEAAEGRRLDLAFDLSPVF